MSKSSKSARVAPRTPSGDGSKNRSPSPTSSPTRAIVVILDEHGDNLASPALATLLRKWRAEDQPAVCFVIGGADGLAPSLYERANLRLAFGAATWPHQLVRIMLLEQLYRAGTILAGHPYHRA